MDSPGGPPPPRHPIQAGPILAVLALAVVLELVSWALERFFLEVRPSKEEDGLRAKAREIEREAKWLDHSPNAFVQASKVRREGALVERNLLRLETARLELARQPWRKQAKRVLGYKTIAVFLFLFFVMEPAFEPAPLLEFDSDWAWPLGRLLSLPNYSPGSLSVVAWGTLCQRFVGRCLRAIP
mmetsp:Transcript_18086/g.51908  ORF Transcript_18086/g.51908 Transcript_18086/m.51908 type:complete len:184 (-) Transcript_18086:49-600(-)